MVVKKQPKKNKAKKQQENLTKEILKKESKEDKTEKEREEVEKKEEKEDLMQNFKKQVEKMEKEIEEYKQLNLRLKAEFDNFKKRTQKEKASVFDMAKSESVSPFLEVLDNLERAVSLVEKKDRFSEGIDLVINKFYDVLKKLGIVEIKGVGEVFNPNFHEAIKVVEDEKFDKNIVCEVFQKGFMLNDVVVRHALVVVANP